MVELPNWKSLESRLDWDLIRAQIKLDAQLLYPFDFEDAESIIRAAGQRFLPADLVNSTIETVEKKQQLSGLYSRLLTEEYPDESVCVHPPFHYVIDIRLNLLGQLKGSESRAGKRMVVDWKTSKNDLDQNWRLNLRDSWQWKIYSALEEIDIFSYRGLSRKGEIVEVVIEDIDPQALKGPVFNFMNGIWDQMAALNNYNIWPQNMPRACGFYGRDCPHRPLCQEGNTPPQFLDLINIDHLSHSSIERFMACAEKFRLSKTLEGFKEVGEESEFGLAVHRGLANLYSQAQLWQMAGL